MNTVILAALVGGGVSLFVTALYLIIFDYCKSESRRKAKEREELEKAIEESRGKEILQ